MKQKLARSPLLLLMVGLLTGVGYFLGIQIADFISRLDLMSSWVSLDGAPEEIEELLVPSNGVLYIRGRSGTVYYLAEHRGRFEGPWAEDSYPNYIDQWECSELADISAPPRDTVSTMMSCDGIHETIITGVALSSAGELSGYYAATPQSFDQLFRGLLIIAISTVTGFAIGIVASIKAIGMLDRRSAGGAAT